MRAARAICAALAVTAAATCHAQRSADRLRGGYMSTANLALVPQMEQVGLNAALPKFGDLESRLDPKNRGLLDRWSEACEAHGLRLMPVFNFYGGHEPQWATRFRRYVDSRGAALPKTPCPVDRRFWHRYLTPRFAALAAYGRDHPLAAALVDLEMYGADTSGYGEPCYCDHCWATLLPGRGLDQALPAERRAAWLEEHGLADAYWAASRGGARAISTACRNAIHRVNPEIEIGALHLDAPNPFAEGFAQGFGAPAKPVLCFTERTYSTGYSPYVREARDRFRALGAHVALVCGIWQSRFPPQHLAENLYHCARESGGYWIYTLQTFEAPNYSPLAGEHSAYWDAMRQANRQLDRLAADPDYDSPLVVRDFERGLVRATSEGFRRYDLVPHEPGPPGPPVRMRGRNIVYFFARAGDALDFEVASRRVGQYRDLGQALLLSPRGDELARADIKPDSPARLQAMAATDGVYGLIINVGVNAAEIARASHPYAVWAGSLANLVSNVPTLYVLPQAPAREASLYLVTEGKGEGLHARFSAPDGRVLAEGDVVGSFDASLPVPEGRVIRLDLSPLPGAVFEDVRITARGGAYPFVSTSPSGLLTRP